MHEITLLQAILLKMTRVQYRSIVKTQGNNQSRFLKMAKDENNFFDWYVIQ